MMLGVALLLGAAAAAFAPPAAHAQVRGDTARARRPPADTAHGGHAGHRPAAPDSAHAGHDAHAGHAMPGMPQRADPGHVVR